MDWKLKPYRKEQYDKLKSQGVAPVFCNLVSNRDFPWVKTKKDIGLLIQSPFSMIENPDNIAGMREVANCMLEIENKDAVIFGDYDADGVLSCFMCEKLLLSLGAHSVDVYLPSRIDDGYGLNDQSVDNFLNICKKPYSLVVVLDCGSSSRIQIEKIKKKLNKAKIVIIDHHIIDNENFSSNADVVSNPRINNATPYCSGGLVYQLVRQCCSRADLNPIDYIAYAAITTISDVCTLTGSNRIIVKNGLEALKSCNDPGLNALFEITEVEKSKCTTEDISFKIGPLINASGRINMASKAFQLLRKKDESSAKKLALFLQKLNEERKRIQKEASEEALKIFEEKRNGKNSALIYCEKWNPSIVGIVASKVSERYGIPVICFGNSKGQIKGSARSVDGINVKAVMDNCKHIFIKYGGHEMAAGATLNPDHINDAWDIFNDEVQKYKKENNIGDPVLSYDYEVDSDLLLRMNDSFCDRLSLMEPFGLGNEVPIFRANSLYCREVKIWKSKTGGFIKFDNTGLNCFGFGPDLKNIENKKCDILFSLTRSFISGEKWQMKLVDYHILES